MKILVDLNDHTLVSCHSFNQLLDLIFIEKRHVSHPFKVSCQSLYFQVELTMHLFDLLVVLFDCNCDSKLLHVVQLSAMSFLESL